MNSNVDSIPQAAGTDGSYRSWLAKAIGELVAEAPDQAPLMLERIVEIIRQERPDLIPAASSREEPPLSR